MGLLVVVAVARFEVVEGCGWLLLLGLRWFWLCAWHGFGVLCGGY